MAENQNAIHIKLENEEALDSKRGVLSTQVALLRSMKTLESYRTSKEKEYELKQDLARKMKEFKIIIANFEKAIPRLKIPEILKHKVSQTLHEPVEKSKSGKKKITEVRDTSIEDQLYEIQRRLNDLQGRNY